MAKPDVSERLGGREAFNGVGFSNSTFAAAKCDGCWIHLLFELVKPMGGRWRPASWPAAGDGRAALACVARGQLGPAYRRFFIRAKTSANEPAY